MAGQYSDYTDEEKKLLEEAANPGASPANSVSPNNTTLPQTNNPVVNDDSNVPAAWNEKNYSGASPANSVSANNTTLPTTSNPIVSSNRGNRDEAGMVPDDYKPPALASGGTGAAGGTKPPATTPGATGGGAAGGTRPPNTTPSTTPSQGGGSGGAGGGQRPPAAVMPYDGPYIKQGAAWDDAKTAAYYKANPDVAKAVAAGKMEDAQSHYEKHGKQEGRSFAAAEAAQVPVAKANNDKLQAELDALRAEKANAAAKADVDNKNATGRAAAVAGLTPRISGVDRWGAQLMDFGGGNPQGVTLTDAELRGIASKAGYGYETVAEGWKNAGGKVGDDKSWAGMLDLPKTPAAGAAPAPFDSAGYLKNNPDVAKAIANGTFKGTAQDHYDQFGKNEVRPGGREATTGETEAAAAAKTFDSAKYLADNPDVAKAIANGTFRGNAFDHYWQLGRNEVRAGGRAFTAAELADRATWPTGNPAAPPPATAPPNVVSGGTEPATPGTKAADPRTDSYPPDDPNGIITTMPINPITKRPYKPGEPRIPDEVVQGPVTGINQGVTPAPPYPVFTPRRSPEDYRGISPRQGDQDGQGNIYDARSGRWVPYVTPTAPTTTPVLPYTPVAPTIFTGQNADSNTVVAGRLIETLPGGADVWEYNDIENVVANRWTGERRPVPSASLGGGGGNPSNATPPAPARPMSVPKNNGLDPVASQSGAWSFDVVSGTITNNITGEVIKV